ncbi:MAG: hypothetical protein OR998_06110, partial [Flavobacteriaceae bacterium]|nr:hypothetical protein [Flavobacteriaceae bacterium]
AVSNTDGTITSQVSANTAAGFSIISYTGNSTAGATVGHNLNAIPEIVIVKTLNSSNNWAVYNKTIGNTKRLSLDESNGASSSRIEWNNTTPTSSVITFGNYSAVNTNQNYIAYAWTSISGYSSIGSYIGNGNSTGPIVNTGFTPRFVMIKATTNDNGGGSWLIYDSARSPSNPRNKRLYPDLGSAEQSSSSYNLDFLTGATKGFQPKDGANYYGYNTLNVEYIYMAFA